jgi:c-di-GMP-related signal transduction protein
MPSTSGLLTAGPATFVARQPILDTSSRVRGYELLYRRSAGASTSVGTSADLATAGVIEALFGIGFETLTGGHRAFLQVSRPLLLAGMPVVLPADRVVLELGSDIEADAEVLVACQALKDAGYSLAIDGFTGTDRTEALIPFADYVKVDCHDAAHARPRLPAVAAAGGPALVAVQVDTATRFQEAASAGYDLFQGFFLGKPVLKAGRAVSAQHVAGVKLLGALHEPDISTLQLAELIKHDAVASFLVLRTVNSAAYALRSTVHSIQDAIVLLGRDTVRRWAALWVLAGLGRQAHSELLTMATVRAHCCEVLAASTGREDAAAEGFMVGLYSLLDAILEQPMPVLLDAMPVSNNVRDALLGVPNAARRTLDCAVAYEAGEWDRTVELAALAGVNPAVLPAAYADALRWSSDLKHSEPR